MTETYKARNRITGRQKQLVLENLWLNYFNDTLFGQGIITETERNRMRTKIKCRTVPLGG